ncbi:hypothetical protein HDA40_004230 [Hamadaea flava]|uniref:DUF4333 domain-containing protein n=1 Tax=Hamadaea flava TaxID=1742688 RepID=A0ABV8LHA8_9ACTN|nr:hypothetical protein [Hamadaea flava]MCP2325723.1 hypothetical protein [Hamadaea flava]
MRKRLVIAGVAAWALLLVGLAVYSYHRDPATVPGQTTVAQARATMDRVTGELSAVSSSVKISEYAESTCEITNARGGRSVKRELTFTTTPGDEATLLRSIAAELPKAYHATTTQGDATVTLYADAGDFVAVRGRKGADPGSVVVSLLSGCREAQ